MRVLLYNFFFLTIGNFSDLSFSPGSPENQLKVIQGTFDFFVQFDVPILRQGVSLIAMRTVQSAGLGLDELHVTPAFPTSEVNES